VDELAGKSSEYFQAGNDCTLDIPRREGDVDRGLLVGDLDLERRGDDR